jgi:hypothetical protein
MIERDYTFSIKFAKISYSLACQVECSYCAAPIGDKCGVPRYAVDEQGTIKVAGRERTLYGQPHYVRCAASVGLLRGTDHNSYELDHDYYINNIPCTYEEAERRSVLWAERALKLKDF